MEAVKHNVEKVFRLFIDYGQSDYIGEPVSKTEHSLQSAMLAERAGFSTEVILGAFLHDIGHLVGMEQGTESMVTEGVNLGAKDHDVIGEQYLQNLGFPPQITEFVRGHVQAKRYLVHKHPAYYEGLSEASKMTLKHQGGSMTVSEAQEFESEAMFLSILQMRRWDELAKVPGCETPPIGRYKDMCLEYLQTQLNDKI